MPGPGPNPRANAKNVVRGPASLWYRPQDDTAVLPSDTLALGGDWAVPATGNALWTPIGATQSGVSISWARKTTDIVIEEQPNAVDVATDTLDPMIDCVLSEDTLEAMALAYGGGTITTTAPTSTNPGVRQIAFSDELAHISLGFEGINNASYWRRGLWQDVLSVATVKTDYNRSKTQRLYAVSFRLLSPVSGIRIREMNLPHT